MDQDQLYQLLLTGYLSLAALTFPVLFFISAPYGRHSRAGWGPTLSSRLGWVIMEAPASLIVAATFVGGEQPRTTMTWVFLALWQAHYLHRAFVYPFRLRSERRGIPVAVVGLGVIFNVVNGYLNGRYMFSLSDGYPDQWLLTLRFILGTALFVSGYALNRVADRILRGLRAPGESGYVIPRAGPFHWVSSPNYLGEILEWLGWALATWSLPGLAFALWTIANLAPRAWTNHQWYRRRFPDYPQKRRVLLPGLW